MVADKLTSRMGSTLMASRWPIFQYWTATGHIAILYWPEWRSSGCRTFAYVNDKVASWLVGKWHHWKAAYTITTRCHRIWDGWGIDKGELEELANLNLNSTTTINSWPWVAIKQRKVNNIDGDAVLKQLQSLLSTPTRLLYRRKGLGRAVEAQLCKLHIADGFHPYKHVVADNAAPNQLANSSQMWHKINGQFAWVKVSSINE